MFVRRYVLKDLATEMYVDAHSSAKNILWHSNIFDAKIFWRIRHAERWHRRLDIEDGMIKIVEVMMIVRNRIRDVLTIIEMGIVERVAPRTDVDKVLAGEPIEEIPEPIQKISGLWDFIPKGTENRYENRRGYKKSHRSDEGEI